MLLPPLITDQGIMVDILTVNKSFLAPLNLSDMMCGIDMIHSASFSSVLKVLL